MNPNSTAIAQNETLLTVESIRGGKPFIGESPFFGRAMDWVALLDELSDHVVRVMKIDTETMGAPQDITEECARQWIFAHDADGFELDEAEMPVFVRNSREWSIWQGEPNEAPRPAIYSTMTHSVQGLVKGATFR